MPSECVCNERMRRHPDRWHPKRIKPKVQFSKDIALMMIHQSKVHLKRRMTLPFQTTNSSMSTRQTTGDSRWVMNTVKKNSPSNPMTSQQIHAFLLDSGVDFDLDLTSDWPEHWSTSYEYIQSANQVQTECKETPKIYYTGISYNANQC